LNAGTAPDGAQTADSVTATSSGSAVRFIIQSVTKAASAIQYAYSFFVKPIAGGRYIAFSVDDGGGNGFSGGLDATTGTTTGATVGAGGVFTSVSATQHVNGWWRVTLVGTSTIATTVRVAVNLAASLTTGFPSANLNAGDGMFIWGLQLEAGAFATSYIRTDATAGGVQRAADVFQITGTNFSSWYNPNQGTFVAEYQKQGEGSGPRVLDGVGGTFLLFGTGATTSRFEVGGTTADATHPTTGQRVKLACSYTATGLSISANGGSVVNSAGAPTLPTITTMYIGNRAAGDRSLNGALARIRYFNRALATALQAIST
jgi:hypothetical protein